MKMLKILSLLIALGYLANAESARAEILQKEWEALLKTESFSEIVERINTKNPKWPPLRREADSQTNTETRELASGLLQLVILQVAVSKVDLSSKAKMLELARALQEQGGYYNLLLAETFVRIVYCSFGYASFHEADKLVDIEKFLNENHFVFDVDKFQQTAREEFSGEISQEVKANTVDFDYLKQLVGWKRLTPPSFKSFNNFKTSQLIEKPAIDLLFTRIVITNWRFNMLMPYVVPYMRTSTDLDHVDPERLQRTLGAEMIGRMQQSTVWRPGPASASEFQEFKDTFSKNVPEIVEFQMAVE